MYRRTALLSLSATLIGCVTTASAPDGTKVTAAQGILALRLSANTTGYVSFVPYGESTFGSRMAESLFGAKGILKMVDGEQYLVLPMDAGEYMWSKVSVGNKVGRLYSSTRFRVRPGSITYIGHIRLFVSENKFTMNALDREADMRDHMRLNFPNYSEAMPFEKVLAEFRL